MSKGTILQYNGRGIGTPSGAYAIENLTPENIKNGVNIGGVVGTFVGDDSGVEVHTNADITLSTIINYNDCMTIRNVMHAPKYISYSRNDTSGSYNKTVFGLNYPYPIDNSTGYVTFKNLDGIYNPPANITFSAVYDSAQHTLTITITNNTSQVAQFLASTYARCILCY